MKFLSVFLIYGSLAALVVFTGVYGLAGIAFCALAFYLYQRVFGTPGDR